MKQHTGDRRCGGAALASELLQGVNSYIEVDVLTATALVHQLLLLKGLKRSNIRNLVRKDWVGLEPAVMQSCVFFIPSERHIPLMGKT